MSSIKVSIDCCAVKARGLFRGHYTFDCPTIKGDVDLYEVDDVPYFLQDKGLLPVNADIHAGDTCTITLWEGNNSEFISQFGSLEPFNPMDLNDDNEMSEGWYDAMESLWEDFWSK